MSSLWLVRFGFSPVLAFALSVAGDVSAQTRGPLSPGRRQAPRDVNLAASQVGETIIVPGTLIEAYTTSLLLETDEGSKVQVILSPGARFVLEDRIITVETLRTGDRVTVHGVRKNPNELQAIQVVMSLDSLIPKASTFPTLIRWNTARPTTQVGAPAEGDEGGPPTLRRRGPDKNHRPSSRKDSPAARETEKELSTPGDTAQPETGDSEGNTG